MLGPTSLLPDDESTPCLPVLLPAGARLGGSSKEQLQKLDGWPRREPGLCFGGGAQAGRAYPRPSKQLKVLVFLFIINGILGISQLGFAMNIHSIALLGSALCTIVDALTYSINMWAEYKRISGTDARTLHRIDVSAASVSILTLVGSTAYTMVEAYKGMSDTRWQMDGPGMITFSCIGVFVDVVSTLMFIWIMDCGGGDRREKRRRREADAAGVAGAGAPVTVGALGAEGGRGEAATPRGPVVAAGGAAAKMSLLSVKNLNMVSVFVHVVIDLARGLAVVVAAFVIHGKASSMPPGRVDAITAFVVTGLSVIGVIFLFAQTARAMCVFRGGDEQA
jgi:Co/Zn/Cd efflux system component